MQQAMQHADDMMVLGHISGLFGIQGWVKVYSHTEPRDNILRYSPWYLSIEGEWRPYPVAQGKQHGKTLIAQLEQCPDRDSAAALVGCKIAVTRQQLPALEEGEYYWRDLLGLRVINLADVDLGQVTNLMETGANDVLVVESQGDGEKHERLIPFIREQVIKNVDIGQGVIRVDWDPDF
ncbi:ribosome maturation factor RimM [Thiohalophilus sp.]|uniref:ribosome maturation factor RimM n=1 Tax=Thiohalophilus sp. TaxID=3028392 RepID=UPI003A0FF427